jgi:hypothetical protein
MWNLSVHEVSSKLLEYSDCALNFKLDYWIWMASGMSKSSGHLSGKSHWAMVDIV